MGKYIRHYLGSYGGGESIICDAKDSIWYGNSVLTDIKGMVYYVSEDHGYYQVDNETDYDFEVGVDEQGRPYLDFQFTNINTDIIHEDTILFVETNACCSSKSCKGQAYGMVLGRPFLTTLTSSYPLPNMNTNGITWLFAHDAGDYKKHRLYIITRTTKYGNTPNSLADLHGGKKPLDWVVNINVRLGIRTAYNEEKKWMIKNFKNYKPIEYLYHNEYTF